MFNQRFFFYTSLVLLSSVVFLLTSLRRQEERIRAEYRTQFKMQVVRPEQEKFNFLRNDIQKLRNRLIEKESTVSDLKRSLMESKRTVYLLKHQVDGDTKCPESGTATTVTKDPEPAPIGEIVVDDLDNITTFEIVTIIVSGDEEIPNLRNLVGSIHQFRTENNVNVAQISVFYFPSLLAPKFQEEIKFWLNVNLISIEDYLLGSSIDKSPAAIDDLIVILLESLSATKRNFLFVDQSLAFPSRELFQSILSKSRADGLVTVADGKTLLLGVSAENSESWQALIKRRLECKRRIASNCTSDFMVRYNYQLDASMLQTTATNSLHFFCYINIRNDLTFVDYLDKPNTAQDGRPLIGIGVPTTGHGLADLKESRMLTIFLPNFFKSITKEECGIFNFRLYIGYDTGDPIWDNVDNLNQLRALMTETLPGNFSSCISLDFVHLPFTNAWLTFIWNRLFARCIRDDCKYFFQANDDLEITDAGWASNFTQTLDNNNGYGVVGPYDPRWNCTLLTQAMVTPKHYERYQNFYPFEIKDWYSDFWITRIYSPDNMFCFSNFRANNIKDQGIRYQLCNRPKWNEAIQRDRFVLTH